MKAIKQGDFFVWAGSYYWKTLRAAKVTEKQVKPDQNGPKKDAFDWIPRVAQRSDVVFVGPLTACEKLVGELERSKKQRDAETTKARVAHERRVRQFIETAEREAA